MPNVTEGRCQSCINFGIDKCTYDRPAKKRGPPKAKETGVAKGASRALASSGTVTASAAAAAVSASLKQEEDTSQLTEFAPLETILQLLDIFYSAVYPIFPYVHVGVLYPSHNPASSSHRIASYPVSPLQISRSSPRIHSVKGILCCSNGIVRPHVSSNTRQGRLLRANTRLAQELAVQRHLLCECCRCFRPR